MRQSTVEKFDASMAATHNYGWSNEKFDGYKKMFEKIHEVHGKQIETISSVGAGDHILFALSELEDVRQINHVDISKYAFLFAFLKFHVIKEYDFTTWISLLNGTMTFNNIFKMLKKSSFKYLIDTLVISKNEAEVAQILSTAWRSDAVNPCNIEFFSDKNTFLRMKKALNNIETYKIYFTSIYTVQLQVNPQSSLLMISNAYNMPERFSFKQFNSKFVISTNLSKPGAIATTTVSSWAFQLHDTQKL